MRCFCFDGRRRANGVHATVVYEKENAVPVWWAPVIPALSSQRLRQEDLEFEFEASRGNIANSNWGVYPRTLVRDALFFIYLI